jgi:hypothetical protein
MSTFDAVFSSLLCDSPIYLIWLVGIVVAIRRWKEHPQVSRLALLGLSILFIEKFGYSLFLASFSQSSGISEMGNASVGFVALVSLGIETLGLGILLWALFGYREKEKRRPQETDDKETSFIN